MIIDLKEFRSIGVSWLLSRKSSFLVTIWFFKSHTSISFQLYMKFSMCSYKFSTFSTSAFNVLVIVILNSLADHSASGSHLSQVLLIILSTESRFLFPSLLLWFFENIGWNTEGVCIYSWKWTCPFLLLCLWRELRNEDLSLSNQDLGWIWILLLWWFPVMNQRLQVLFASPDY